MSFLIHALPFDAFAGLSSLDDDDLRRRGVRRVVADSNPGYPCRVSLKDAEIGERLWLLPYRHLDVETPYRAAGPIFVREAARQAHPAAGEVPALLRSRLLSLRAYDADGMMVAADAVEGRGLESAIAASFAKTGVAYLHVHYAKPGCYACRVVRA